MKILQETLVPQTFTFIPREFVLSVNYTITNEETNKSVLATNIATITNGGYLEINEIFTLKEGVFYNIYIEKTDGTLIFRGKIFCTNQSIDKFTVNENKFTEDTSRDNTYIVYGQ